jgi:hypothetical protein
VNSGTVNVRSSVIELTAPSSTGATFTGVTPGFAETPSGNLENLTIAGSASGLTGVLASVNDPGAADAATVNLNSSVITGVATTLSRNAGNGDPANITTDYSNYDAALNNDNGNPGTLTENNRTNLTPGFVDAANGDFHLLPTSALIDIGDPAVPGVTERDIDGDLRALDGVFPDCPVGDGRRDIGADEFVADCVPPDTAITTGLTTGASTNDSTQSFGFTSTEAPAAFQCSVDGQAATACSSPFTTLPLADGSHSFAVAAVDGNQNLDPSPAARTFTVDTKPPVTTITGRHKLKTKKKRARVSFSLKSDPGATFECSVDGAAFAACSSPFSARLRRGAHTLTVRATDRAGNVEASPVVFRVRVVKKKPKQR